MGPRTTVSGACLLSAAQSRIPWEGLGYGKSPRGSRTSRDPRGAKAPAANFARLAAMARAFRLVVTRTQAIRPSIRWLPLALLGCLLEVFCATATPSEGYVSEGSLVDLVDLGRLARLRHPSVLRRTITSSRGALQPDSQPTDHEAKDQCTVLAALVGPGVLQGLTLAHPEGSGSTKARAGSGQLRIHIDGDDRPVVSVDFSPETTAEDPRELAGVMNRWPGGLATRVPVLFRQSCQITVQGMDVIAYQVIWTRLPESAAIQTNASNPSPAAPLLLERAVAVWSRPDRYEQAELRHCQPAVYQFEGEGRSTHIFALPPGPATVRSFQVIPSRGTTQAWNRARLRFFWDQHEQDMTSPDVAAGVDVELGLAVGGPPEAGSISLPAGIRGGVWYLRLPMPYRRIGVVRLDTEGPVAATIRVLVEREVASDAGYLRVATLGEQGLQPEVGLQTEDVRGVPAVHQQGRGHLVGIVALGPEEARGLADGPLRVVVDGLPIDRELSPDPLLPRLAKAQPLEKVRGPSSSKVTDFGQPSSATGLGLRLAGQGEGRLRAYWFVPDVVPFRRLLAAWVEPGRAPAVTPGFQAAVFWYSEFPGPSRSATRLLRP